jgi:hypothetical protein
MPWDQRDRLTVAEMQAVIRHVKEVIASSNENR